MTRNSTETHNTVFKLPQKCFIYCGKTTELCRKQETFDIILSTIDKGNFIHKYLIVDLRTIESKN